MKVTQFVRLFAVAALAIGMVADSFAASIVFDDFNAPGKGHFGTVPYSSGTNQNTANTSASVVATTGTREGAGSLDVNLNMTAAAAATRVRFVSGSAAPANNTPFTTTAGVDGFIGFYLKTTSTGWTTHIALDGPANSSAQMRGSQPAAPIIADGQWHLYEWDLDAAIWGTVPGIATVASAALPDNTYTIDSVYFINPSGPASATISIDFVAKSDSGSVAALLPAVPEPATLALAGMGAMGLVACARRRNG